MRLKTSLSVPVDCTAALELSPRLASIAHLMALGNPSLLQHDPLALFCSARCPGSLILRSYDALRKLRDERRTVISGFHSPVEQEALLTLMKGQGGIVICPARSINKMRIPSAWHQALRDKRLLVISPFATNEERITARLAARRNEFVAAVANRVLIIHAEPDGRTAKLAQTILKRGAQLLTLDAPENKHLLDMGAETF